MATYYVKSGGGTGTGLDDANAWSYAKFNATTVSPGDTVLFKRGDTFTGTFTTSNNTSSPAVSYGAYGTGERPVISGFLTLSEWTLSSGNIYYASIDVPILNIVLIDDVIKSVSRYPKTGYLPYTSHSGNASITGAQIGSLPFNASGGELVIRKYRWITDRHPISSHSGSTLSFTTNNDYGNNSVYEPVNGNGFFIQNHIGTLTADGDWYYDNTNNRLYVYFSGSPSGRVVKAASLNEVLFNNYYSNFTFDSLIFEGANKSGCHHVGTGNTSYTNCQWRKQGGDGVYGIDTDTIDFINCSIEDCFNNGILFENNGHNTTITNLNIRRCGIIPGAGRSGEGAQVGISITGNGTTITESDLADIGYNGIAFYGSNVLVEDNDVDNFCLTKDDGGGIYTYNGGGTPTNRIIRGNRIRNAIGAFEGVESYYYEAFGKAAGVYLDNNSINTIVEDNDIYDGDWGGVVINENTGNEVQNNRVTNFRYQCLMMKYDSSKLRNLLISNNRFICESSTQYGVMIVLFSATDNPYLFGVIERNTYSKPGNNTMIGIDRRYNTTTSEYTMPEWRSLFGVDKHSTSNPKLARLNGDYLTHNNKLIVISQ